MKRKYLLISPVGKKSLDICRGWDAPNRGFDMLFIYYDSSGYEDFFSISDYLLLRPGFKYPLLHQVLTEQPFLLLKYDYFFFPDDDLRMTAGDIEKLFSFAQQQHINICQPSLYPINVGWPVTAHHPFTAYRYVSMVEVMCPLFSRDALKKCLPSFIESRSGWGLEVAWYRLLGSKKEQFIICDLVIVIHEGIRANGSVYYDNLQQAGISPYHDLDTLEQKYKLKTEISVLKYIYKSEFN